MIMDFLILALFAASVLFSMRKGFAMTLAGFLRGLFSVVVAWLLCDDLSRLLLKLPFVHELAAERLRLGISARWEGSAVFNMLPTLFTERSSIADELVNEGVTKLAWLLLTIVSFLVILLLVRAAARLLERSFSHRFQGGFIGFSDRFFGLLLGCVVGAFNVLLALALLLPLAGLLFPSLSAALPGWFEGSFFARDIYDNNLLLILLRDFMA